MNIADRIQNLRRLKGISQEELADKIGVSRQSISKWESEQSTPDIDKVILLSDFFETTTDYLLKGIESKKEGNEKLDTRISTAIATLFNLAAIVVAIAIWIDKQTIAAVAVGIVMIGFGCLLYFIGKVIGDNNQSATKWFWIINIWLIILIPLASGFNIVQGFLGGFSWQISPLPQLGNSHLVYASFWLIYVLIGIIVDICVYQRKKK